MDYVFTVRIAMCTTGHVLSQQDASIMFSQHIDIMFAQHILRHAPFLVCNLGYVFTLRDEMRIDFFALRNTLREICRKRV